MEELIPDKDDYALKVHYTVATFLTHAKWEINIKTIIKDKIKTSLPFQHSKCKREGEERQT